MWWKLLIAFALGIIAAEAFRWVRYKLEHALD